MPLVNHTLHTTGRVGLLASYLVASMLLLSPLAASAETEEAAEEATTAKSEYVRFHPDFVVNLKPSKPHFVMVTVQDMSPGMDGILAAKHQMLAICRRILMVLSEQTPESISSVEGKQKLMEDALASIQELMIAETGVPSINAVFFTDFAAQ